MPAFFSNSEKQEVQSKFGGTVIGESAMANTSDVGSLVEFTFNVSHLHRPDTVLNLQNFIPRLQYVRYSPTFPSTTPCL